MMQKQKWLVALLQVWVVAVVSWTWGAETCWPGRYGQQYYEGHRSGG